jgi:hypothetical protein
MHNPYDEKGDEIDAKYSVETVRHGFDLIIESQGGIHWRAHASEC